MTEPEKPRPRGPTMVDAAAITINTASDYVNHVPAEFAVTKVVTNEGSTSYVVTFIDHVLLPALKTSPSGSLEHGLQPERRVRTTINLSKALYDNLVEVIAEIERHNADADK